MDTKTPNLAPLPNADASDWRRQGRDSIVLSAVAAILSALSCPLWRQTQTCEGFECLGASFFAAGFSGLVVPVVAWVTWRLAHVPRAFSLAVVATVVGHVLAWVASLVQTVRFDFASEVPLAPAFVFLLLGGASGLIALVLVGKGPWPLWTRVLLLVLIGVIGPGAHAGQQYLRTEHHERDLRSVGVTMYLPEISDRAAPSYTSAYRDRVAISYYYEAPPGGEYDYPSVALLPATSQSATCLDAERAGYLSELLNSSCRTTPDGFVADDGYQHYVAVVREDTMLVARFKPSVFDDAAIAEALRRAPDSSVDELARL